MPLMNNLFLQQVRSSIEIAKQTIPSVFVRCGHQMAEQTRDQAASDGICYYCRGCKTTKSIRYISFFTTSRLTLQ